MTKETRSKLSFILLWFFLITSFMVVAFFVLTEATGYRFNWQTMNLEMTGLISLEGTPRDVKISVNGKVMPQGLPLRLTKILPGQYQIEISKDKYSSWTKIYTVAGGQAYEDKKVTLFYAEPIVKENTNLKLEQVASDYKDKVARLTLKNNEIWYKEELVSRFGATLHGAILSDDRKHIFFQLNDEIRVIELDGKNNTKLLTLPIKDQVSFLPINDSKIVYILSDKVYEAQIR